MSPGLKNVILSEHKNKKRSAVYLRDADLKDVVLDQLLAQHDNAELNAQLDEAASWRTLRETHTSFVHTFTYQPNGKKHRYKVQIQTSSIR